MIGIDIGGANLKFASVKRVVTTPFELWLRPDELDDELRLLAGDEIDQPAAVTMTGEIADGFRSKQDGVARIVAAVQNVFASAMFYQTNGQFVGAAKASSNWQLTAAANWHAMATWASQQSSVKNGFVIDMGSTTTDIVPVANGVPCGQGQTDLERIRAGELVYCGIRRSGLNGVLHFVESFGTRLRIANERFATIQDALIVLGRLPESHSTETADGRAADLAHAAQRLARMLCCDADELGPDSLTEIAQQFVTAHECQIAERVRTVTERFADFDRTFVLCGEGAWFIRELLGEMYSREHDGLKIDDLSQRISDNVAACAPAVAVRELALQRPHV